MAMTLRRWLLVGLVGWLLAGCATADGVTRIEGTLPGWGEVPDFSSPLLLPGEVTGINMNPFAMPVLSGNEFCLRVNEDVLGEPLMSGLPVEMNINMRLLEPEELMISRDETAGQTVYCAAPLLDIGRHTLDIDLNTGDGLQVYQFIFDSRRITGWRPLSMHPGEVTGMAFAPGEPSVMTQTDATVCWRTNERALPNDFNPAQVLDVRLEGESLVPEWIESQGGMLETCFILDLAPGTYTMSAVLAVVDVEPQEMLPITVEEWYRWTLHVDEGVS